MSVFSNKNNQTNECKILRKRSICYVDQLTTFNYVLCKPQSLRESTVSKLIGKTVYNEEEMNKSIWSISVF